MKAHDPISTFTSTALLCLLSTTGCDPNASASAKSTAKEAPAGAAGEKAAPAADEEPPPPAGEPHHCDFIKATGTCFQWTLAADAVDPKKEFCTSSRGTFAAGACPSEGDLGTCVLEGDKDIHYYDTHKHYQLSPAQTECTALKQGTWTAS